MWRAPKHDAGFHLNRLPVPQIRLELPLSQGIGNDFCLIGKRAEKVNVLDLASLVDNDSDRNCVEPVLGEDRINPRNHVLVAGVVLDTHREPFPRPSPLLDSPPSVTSSCPCPIASSTAVSYHGWLAPVPPHGSGFRWLEHTNAAVPPETNRQRR